MNVLFALMESALGESVWTESARSGWNKVGELIVQGVGCAEVND